VAALALLMVTVALVAARHRWPAGLAVWLAYAITLAPVSGLVHAGPQLVADRFGYIPSLGLCLLLGAGVAASARSVGLVRLVPIVVGLWIASLATLTWSQVQVWRDTDTLFTYTLAVDPDCGWCHAQYGGALANRGDLAGAIPHLQRAAGLRPHRFRDQAHAGLALLQAGRAAEALPYLERAVAIQPDNAEARRRLAAVLTQLGRPDDAAPHLARARGGESPPGLPRPASLTR
jgi:tetratricopeptide (TPR) repeat protein